MTGLPAAHSAAPTSRRLLTRLLIIAAVYALITVIIAGPLLWAGMDVTAPEFFVMVLGLAPLALFVPLIDMFTVVRLYRPVAAALQQSGGSDPAAAQAGLARLLNLPALTFFRIMTIHWLSSALLGVSGTFIIGPMLGLTLSLRQLIPFTLLTFTAAATHAVFEYLAVQKAIRPVVPLLRRASPDPFPTDQLIPATIRQRLLYTMLCIGFIPILLLSVTVMIRVYNTLARVGAPDPLALIAPIILWIALLMGVIALFMTLMAILFSRDFKWLADQLVTAMYAVRAGNLDQHLEITTTDEFADLYAGFNAMTEGLRERARLHDAFGRYVSPDLARQIAAEGISMAGEARTASVMFCDIRSFTALSSTMQPAGIVAMLNRYFAVVEPAVKAEGGWINKFLGDGFMAVFGAPVPSEDHARRAVCAALAIRRVTAAFNADQRAASLPELAFGIGIAAGEMVAGTIGSPDRLEYTVIGDAVNLASRIEALNKSFGTDILIAEAVYHAAPDAAPVDQMPPTEVKGVAGAVQVYAIRP